MFIWMIIQILCESLPISSSGHVLLIQKIYQYFNWPWYSHHQEIINFLLHGPALCIMTAYFFKIWWRMITNHDFSYNYLCRFSWVQKFFKPIRFVLIADIITFLFWKADLVSFANQFSWSLFLGFCITGLSLYCSKYFIYQDKMYTWNLKEACLLGIAQGTAFWPGISRFAYTFYIASAGLKYSQKQSFALSFLIQFPLVFVAFFKGLWCLKSDGLFLLKFFNATMFLCIILMSIISYLIFKCVGYLIQKNCVWYVSWYMLLPIVISILV